MCLLQSEEWHKAKHSSHPVLLCEGCVLSPGRWNSSCDSSASSSISKGSSSLPSPAASFQREGNTQLHTDSIASRGSNFGPAMLAMPDAA